MDQRTVFMTTVSYRVENVGDQHARLDDINYENNPDRLIKDVPIVDRENMTIVDVGKG